MAKLYLGDDHSDIILLPSKIIFQVEAVGDGAHRERWLISVIIGLGLRKGCNAKRDFFKVGQIACSLKAWPDAVVDNLLVEDVIGNAVCREYNDIVVLNLVLSVLRVVGQTAVLPALIRVIELIGLLFGTVKFEDAVVARIRPQYHVRRVS